MKRRSWVHAWGIGGAACCFFMGSAFATQRSMLAKDPLNAGLIHRWQFDGNCFDSVGNLSTKPVGPVGYTEVGSGKGIVFDGSTTGMVLPPEKDMQFQASFSISVWANLFARPSASHMWSAIIFDGDDRPGLDPYALQADPNGKIQFLITGAGGASTLDAPIPLNTFVYLTATYNKQTGIQSFYENGKLVNQATGVPNLTPVVGLDGNQNPGIGIGTNNAFPKSSYHFGWNGILSDLRIYNRALTPAEALELFHRGVTRPLGTKINPINP